MPFKLKLLINAILIATVSSHPALSAINHFYKNNRFKGAFLTCSIKRCTADLVAQYIAAAKKERQLRDEESKVSAIDNAISKLNPIKRARGGHLTERQMRFSLDLRRSAMFLLYGGFYQGCAQELIYNDILPFLGTGTDMLTVVKKVGVDMGVIAPFICIPSEFPVRSSTFLLLSTYLSLTSPFNLQSQWHIW